MRVIAISALPLWVMGDRKGLPTIYLGVKGFVDAGHEVHFISPLLHLWRADLDAEYGKRPKETIYDGIHVYRFAIPLHSFLRKMSRVKMHSWRLIRYPQRIVSLFSLGALWALFTASALVMACHIARTHKPDVVYAHNGIATTAAYLLAKRYRVPNISRIYGTFLSQIPWKKRYLLMHFPEVLGFKTPCAYLIVTNDGTQGDQIAARFGVPPERLKFWVNGVDKSVCDVALSGAEAKKRIGIQPDKMVILSLNRLDVWKGIHKLIRAVPEIVARRPDTVVLIVGDGTERPELVRLAQSLNLQDRVRFEGAVPHAVVQNYMRAADVFVSTQDVTNFGNHLIEAMTCGCCIVTLNNGDTGKFVKHNVNGILLEPDRLDQLPSAIVDLLGDAATRQRLGQHAALFAHENFQTWDERMKTEVALIEDLVGPGRTPSRGRARIMRIIAVSALPLWVMGERKGLPSLYYWAKSFVNAGHEVHFVTPYRHLWRDDLDAEYKKRPMHELYEGIHVHRFTIPLLPLLRKLSIATQSPWGKARYVNRVFGLAALSAIWALFTVRSFRRAWRIAKEGRPDVVYAHNGIAAVSVYLLARKFKVPNITRIYGTFLSQIPWKKLHLLLYFPEVIGFKMPCDYLIVDNDGTRGDAVAARLGVPQSRLRFWMNGVDKHMYDPDLTVSEAKRRLGVPLDKKVILALGRLDRWKGIDKIIRAVPDIVSRYPDVLVLIVGDGSEKRSLISLTGAVGAERIIRFEGAVPHDRVAAYMHAADVFVSTQDVTNFGIHIMEAMVCGRCIVTLNNGDTGSFVTNDSTGMLLDPERLDLLPSTIVTLLRDDDLRRRLGERARLYAEANFRTWEERMDEEVKLIEDLLGGPREMGAAQS